MVSVQYIFYSNKFFRILLKFLNQCFISLHACIVLYKVNIKAVQYNIFSRLSHFKCTGRLLSSHCLNKWKVITFKLYDRIYLIIIYHLFVFCIYVKIDLRPAFLLALISISIKFYQKYGCPIQIKINVIKLYSYIKKCRQIYKCDLILLNKII